MNNDRQPIPLIYVAGPYRAETRFLVERNIHRAEAMGVVVAQKGAYPVIPHANTRGYFEDLQPGEFWLEATLQLMRRCDGVLLLERWSESSGARAEVKEANRLQIPVFYTVGEFGFWMDNARPFPVPKGVG